MAKLPWNEETTGRVKDYVADIVEVLESLGYATTSYLEKYIYDTHSKHFTEEDLSVIKDGRKTDRRVKWKNDIDWAKAHLTRNGRMGTFNHKGEKYHYLIPASVGHVKGVRLYDQEEVRGIQEAQMDAYRRLLDETK